MFIIIGGLGFLILLISAVFGHDHDHDFADHDHDGMHDGDKGPSVFSIKMFAIAMVGFGGTGFGFQTGTDWPTSLVTLAACGGALVMGALGYVIIKSFWGQQTSSTVKASDIIGCTGRLVDAIPQNGVGQVECPVRGRQDMFLARTNDGHAIASGRTVKIIEKSGQHVIVEEA